MKYGKKTHIDDAFICENLMGPNCLRIIEELMHGISLPPKAKILDLGCGKGLTSLFLASEYDCHVFATDLWIDATENHERFVNQAMDDVIVTIRAEAHTLPYAKQYFDAIVSIDSYQYFGAEASYLDEYIAPLLTVGGILAVSMPALKTGMVQTDLPKKLTAFWGDNDIDFYPLQWWQQLWENSSQMVPVKAVSHTCHSAAWNDWLACNNPYAKHDIPMIEVEGGKYFDTIGLIYQKRG